MAKSIGSLFVEYRATADKYLADLKQMAKDSKEFERTIAPLKNKVLEIGTGMSIVGGAVTTAFIAMSKQAANYGDAIRDASIRTGVSAQALAGLKFAAEQTGTSFEAVQTGLARMSRNALAASQGTKQSAQAFSALGVSVKDSSGHLRAQADILSDVQDKLSKMKDGTEKSALAQAVFGRQAVQMTEFLNQDTAAMKAFSDQAKEMGLEVLPEMLKASDDFNDALNAMSNAQLGLSNTIGQQLLPALTKATNLITGLIVEFRKWVAQHPEVTRGLFAISAAIAGGGGLLLSLGALLTIVPKLVSAFGLLSPPVLIATAAIGGLVAAFVAFPKFRGFVIAALHDLVETFAFFGSEISSVGKALYELGTGKPLVALKTLSDSVDARFKAAADAGIAFDGAIKAVGNALNFTAAPLAKTKQQLDDVGLSFDDVGKKAKETVERIITANNSFIRQHLSDVEEVGRKWIDVMSDAYSKDLGAFIKSRQTIMDLQDKNRGQLQEGLQKQLDQNGKWIDAMSEQYSKGLGENIKAKETAIDKIDKLNEKALEDFKRAQQQAIDSVKNSAGKVFDDMFVKGQNVFSSLKNLLKGGALSLGRAIFEDVAGALLGPIKQAFDKFFKGLISGPLEAFGQALSKRLSKSIADAGVNAGVSAASGAGAAASSAAGAGGAASSAGSAASSGAMSWISLGLQVAQLGVSAFAGRGRAQRTEENTRESRDWLELQTNAWNPLFNQMVFYQKGIYESIRGGGISGNGRMGPGVADVRPVSTSSSTMVQPIVNVNPTFNMQFDKEMSDLEIRNMMERMTVALDTGIRGMRERWAQILFNSDSPGTTVPVGI